MAKLIRKISVGKDYKNDAMHYAVGQEVYGGHTICDIIEEENKFSVYIKKDKDVLPWKDFNKNMAVSVEYNLEYQLMTGYIGMLKDLGITQDQMDYVTNHLTTIEFESDMYHKSESKIHGIGVFALRKILKEEIIGLGSIDCKHKTILGRYTNHSDDNNAMFYYLKTRDVVMVAERDIDKDEEILINYKKKNIQKKKKNKIR